MKAVIKFEDKNATVTERVFIGTPENVHNEVQMFISGYFEAYEQHKTETIMAGIIAVVEPLETTDDEAVD